MLKRGGVNRKAVSPLIATVLLIAFAVALGAVVMSWGRNFVETQAGEIEEQSSEQMTCLLDTSIELIGNGLCYRESLDQVEFSIANNGRSQIAGINILIIDNTSEPVTHTNTTSIESGGAKKYIMQGILNFPDYAELKPLMTVGTKNIICMDHVIEVEKIETC